jgi:hypothetical protein
MPSFLGEIYKSAHKNSGQVYQSARNRSGEIYQNARKQSGLVYQNARKQSGLVYENARKRPGLTIGTAATAVAAAGLGIGLSAGSSPAASAASVPAAVHAADQAHQAASAASHAASSASSAHGAPTSVPASATNRTAVTVRTGGSAGTTSGAHSATATHTTSATHSAPQRPAQPPKPYLIYDSVTPTAIPAHHEVATYATGPFAVPAAQVAHRNVMWIDTNGSDPNAGALDIEPGDATPQVAATWTKEKLSSDPHALAVLYTMQSEWPSVQSAISQLPSWMQHHVRWWIADPTGYPHVVPGANATQWYWGQNYDITTANPGFQTNP